MLPLTKSQSPRGYLRLSYNGPVLVSGTDVQQSWDLTALPEYIRADPAFKNSLLIFTRGSSTLTDVSSEVAFDPPTGVPEALVLTLSSSTLAEIKLDVWCLHSLLGAVSDAPKLYFIPQPSTGGLAPFLSDLKGQPILIESTGIHTLVPAPPVGYVRFIGYEMSQAMRYIAGAHIWASDGGGSLPGGDIDAQFSISGLSFGPTSTGLGSDIFPQKGLYLLPTESFQIDVLAFNNGANRVVGRATWFDLPATDLTTVRSFINDTSTLTLISAVAAEKMAMAFYDTQLNWGWLNGGWVTVDNRDDIEHNWLFENVIAGETIGLGTLTVAANSIGSKEIKEPLFEDGELRMTMQEGVDANPPRAYFTYKTVDAQT